MAPASVYDGNVLQLFWRRALVTVLSVVTLGIYIPWGICLVETYIYGHTVIDGHRFFFDGKGGELFGRYMVGYFLSIVTIGIYYVFFFRSEIRRWIIYHTHMEDTRGNSL